LHTLGVATTTTTALTILNRDAPNYSAITFIDVAPFVTNLRLAKANPPNLAVAVPANYNLTITNGGGIASSASFTLRDQLPHNIHYNSVAIVSGITSLTACATTGTLAAGLL
jgi:hypothetical protein